MKDMDIAEVARMTGFPASTLRYYEERGLSPHTAAGACAAFSIPAL